MKTVQVEFKSNGKQYVFFDNNIELLAGENVIVETERGQQFGKITRINGEDSKEDHACVLRVASDDDAKQNEKNIRESERAVNIAQNMAIDLKLDMKFINAFYTFDQKQLVFYFLADNRVDFRELAKSLAGKYKTRIELRQIGARDKAREVSGLGPCGRKVCCSSFLNDLDSVGISMVKNQNLSLNPTKINGLCGRLLCCLNYEDDMYTENRKELPEIGSRIKDSDGFEGMVIFVDIPRKKYILINETGEKKQVIIKSKCDECEKKCRDK